MNPATIPVRKNHLKVVSGKNVVRSRLNASQNQGKLQGITSSSWISEWRTIYGHIDHGSSHKCASKPNCEATASSFEQSDATKITRQSDEPTADNTWCERVATPSVPRQLRVNSFLVYGPTQYRVTTFQ